MKLKGINPGMVISWKTQDEKVALLEELERLGYEWYGTKRKPTEACDDKDIGHAIFVYNDNGYKNITHSDKLEKVTHKFSDLIIPEPELSAEEALLVYDQMCRENYCCNDCPLYGILGHECTHKMDGHITEIMDAIKKWKAEREKKEQEIETVDICRIIEIQPDGRKRCVHEEDIKSELPFGGDERQKVEEILKRYCMEHGGEYIAVHEVVSRVKAVE